MKKQDNQQRVGVGVTSVLMILVVLAMTALSLLALGSANTNEKMTQRNADISSSYYVAADEAQRKLAQIDAVLAEGLAQEGDLLWYEENGPEGVIWEETLDGLTFTFMVETPHEQAVEVVGLVTEGPARYLITGHRVIENATFEENFLVLMGD